MKILQVTPYFAPAWAYGGPPRVMHAYAAGLAERGHQVEVFTTDVLDERHRATPRVETIDGVRVHRFPNVSTGSRGRRRNTCPAGSSPHSCVPPTVTTSFMSRTPGRMSRHRPSSPRQPAGVRSWCLRSGPLPRSSGLRGAVKDVVRPGVCEARCCDAHPVLLAQTSHEASPLPRVRRPRRSVPDTLPLPLPPVCPPEVRWNIPWAAFGSSNRRRGCSFSSDGSTGLKGPRPSDRRGRAASRR